MNIHFVFVAFLSLFLSASVSASTVNIDLTGATSGTFIDGIGADFAGPFVGQSIVGSYGISGSPSGPLTLQPSNNLDAAYWNGSNSILPYPNNMGPISFLLDSLAASTEWTMGFASPLSSVKIDFFDFSGSLVNSLEQQLLTDYNTYSFGGFGSFADLTIYDNNDSKGLRYQNISYDTAAVSKVPIPSTIILFGSALFGIGGLRRRFSLVAAAD